MSDDDGTGAGFFFALILIAFLALAFAVGRMSGEYSMEYDCAHYGKHVDAKEVYTCEKQKDAQ